jgi:hypothetical protein
MNKSPFRLKQIRRSILETLSMAGGYALEGEALQRHVDDLLRPPLQPDEWTAQITWLSENEHIRRVTEDMDATLVQWTITARGKTLLSATQI